jgi:hypothetical protein
VNIDRQIVLEVDEASLLALVCSCKSPVLVFLQLQLIV